MYARDVDGRTLTLQVSGQLWRRSLVMRDLETETLWSHLLGKAVEGELKGETLERLPSDMLTWAAWKARHPDTTVLNLSRIRDHYTPEFYEEPERFVIGFPGEQPRHCAFTTLQQHPVLNIEADGEPAVLLFDRESTSALVFHREIGDRVLSFSLTEDGRLVDDQTGSVWDRSTGTAIAGHLQGRTLRPLVGLVSYTRAWMTFHPDSAEILPDATNAVP